MISLDWVSDYVDIKDQDVFELAKKITTAGINIEKVITTHIDHLVVGEVQECKPHPDSEICQVWVGDKVLQIVCGAKNVKEKMKVVVALPGAILPPHFEIHKAKKRGIESFGMLCSLSELGLEEESEGIFELGRDALVGEDACNYLPNQDTLYELDIHKHRNNDCYYHIGFAYEIASILNRKVTLPDLSFLEDKSDSVSNHIDLSVDTKKCPYYTGKMALNIEIKESPDFIKKRLERAGMRSINNVVDISNYVMLEFGQPMHFFDAEKLGKKVLVRDAKDKEEIVTLDGQKRVLSKNDIVITDGKKPVCLAGVMGGENTEVDENTKNIFIEAAIFDPVSIRYTASNHNLKSEASIRYGKGLCKQYCDMALERACHLLSKYANATILSGTLNVDQLEKKENVVSFKASAVNQLLGMEISEEDMKVELNRLDFPFEVKDGLFTVHIPSRRLDIDNNVNDIAEEIGRLYGYQNLKSTLPRVEIRQGKYVGSVKYRKEVSKRLRTLGLNEVKTYTLISPEMAHTFDYENKVKVVLPNPMSNDKSVVRTSILPSLYQVYLYNKARKVEDILIYEVSNTYDKSYQEDVKAAGLLSGNYVSNSWGYKEKIDFYLVKGIVENLLDYMGFRNRYSFKSCVCDSFHPYVCAKVYLDDEEIGVIGRIHPRVNKEEIYLFELSLTSLMRNIKPLKYKSVSKYPTITKDFAVVLNKNILVGEVLDVIKKSGGRNLVFLDVFDVYEGDKISLNQKSVAFKLVFQDENRTLVEEEVMELFNKIIDQVVKTFKAELRDK